MAPNTLLRTHGSARAPVTSFLESDYLQSTEATDIGALWAEGAASFQTDKSRLESAGVETEPSEPLTEPRATR